MSRQTSKGSPDLIFPAEPADSQRAGRTFGVLAMRWALFAFPVWTSIAPGGRAEAQKRPCLPSVGYDTAKLARTSHARTYGAVATLEKELLPNIKSDGSRYDDSGGGIYLGFQSLFDAVSVPACEGQVRPYDVHAYRIGMGVRNKRVGFYYAAAANMGYLSQGPGDSAGGMAINYMIGHGYAALAPLLGEQGIEVDDLSAMSLDYVAMLTLDAELVEVGVGYVGSTGLYATVIEDRTGAYFRGLIDLKDDPVGGVLNYFSVGLDGFDYFISPTLAGVTDIGVRKRLWSVPTGLVRDELSEFWLAQVGQRSILGYLDLLGSYSWEPVAQFRDATFTLHTRGYHPELMRRGFDKKAPGIAAGLTLGTVNLPAMPYAGVEGGPQFSFALDAVFSRAPRGTGMGAQVKASLRRNHSDTLELFPYAHGAWDFNLEVLLYL